MKTYIKKIFLILLGIFLSLILLECGLRTTGLTISSFQQYKNNKALKNKSNYTIMCLGESTTHGQYPIQLQEILNKKYPNKFSIIDCGLGGTNLETILDLLDNNIQKYKPNIAICMLGINNGLTLNEKENSSNEYINKKLKINLKITKLFILLKKHILTLLETKQVLANNIEYKNLKKLKLTEGYINKHNYIQAEKILKELLNENPNDEIAFIKLTTLYFHYYSKYHNLGYQMAVEGLNKNYTIQKEWYYKMIFEYNYKKKNIQTLKKYINKMFFNNDINIFETDIKYFLYGFIKDYISQEQKKQILNIIIKTNDGDYGLLANECIKKQEYNKAKEYFLKAEELRLEYPNLETYGLYKQIIKKLIDNNIKVICMQYPVRSIKSLQEQLKNESFFDKITFISNEQNFKDALMQYEYNKIFTDQFAGDFGHCTNLGNTMIAENVVNTLEELIN